MILRHASKALLLSVYAYAALFAATRASGKLSDKYSVERSLLRSRPIAKKGVEADRILLLYRIPFHSNKLVFVYHINCMYS